MPSSIDRIVYILGDGPVVGPTVGVDARIDYLSARPECRKLAIQHRAAIPKKYKHNYLIYVVDIPWISGAGGVTEN